MESDSNSKGEYVSLNNLSKVEEQENEADDFEIKFPLHYSAVIGNTDRVKELLKEGQSIFAKDEYGRTPLHWAASGWGGDDTQSFRCVKALLKSQELGDAEVDKQRKAGDAEVDKERKAGDAEVDKQPASKAGYINFQDKFGETAVHFAAQNGSKIITEYLIQAGGNVNIRSEEGMEPKHLILENIPEAMVRLCDNSITIASGRDPTKPKLDVNLNFGSIVETMEKPPVSEGESTNNCVGKLPVESALLKNGLNSSNKYCKDILVHPLVQIFLELKWKKIRVLFYTSIVFHIIWLILYTMFAVDVYLKSCPYIPPGDNSSGNASSEVERVRRHTSGGGASNNRNPSDSSEPERTRFTWFGELFSSVNDNEELTCDLNEVSMATAYILLIITLVIALKEIFEFSKAERKIKDYFLRMENIGQWLLIASVLLSSWPVFSLDENMPEWQYSTVAFGIFLAWSLILSQIGKLPKLGIYVEMLVKVLKRFALFIMTFASLLIAFALSLSILIPGKPAFSSLPLALLKVLMMMIGELNYDEVFHGDEEITPFPIAGHILFAIFAVIVTIILINLLIGFTVSDIQGLQHDAEVSALLAKLEQIHFMDSFLLSDIVQMFFGRCNRTESLQNFLLVTNPLDSDGMIVRKSIEEIPKELEKDVRRLAASNIQEDGPGQDAADEKKEKLRTLLKTITAEILAKSFPETSTAPK